MSNKIKGTWDKQLNSVLYICRSLIQSIEKDERVASRVQAHCLEVALDKLEEFSKDDLVQEFIIKDEPDETFFQHLNKD